jgi:hypothetical protein
MNKKPDENKVIDVLIDKLLKERLKSVVINYKRYCKENQIELDLNIILIIQEDQDLIESLILNPIKNSSIKKQINQ